MKARAAGAAITRERIVQAACSVYARLGFRRASIQAIAREADVSPATVLNHFASADQLLAVSLEHLTAQLGLPEPVDVRELGSLERRVARICHALAVCYERGEKLYAVYSRDRDMPTVQAANDAFYRRVDALVRAALGRRDRRTMAVVHMLTGWSSFHQLRAAGMSSSAAADVVSGLVLAWLRSRARKGRSP
jgi:AcrR family transcriptional regulator